ncbi:hypothetical protein A8F94_07510 [Bacillus sp. FJAT-27225]|uniref:hypothetical protein n=1 Tax=Bacillus sp. FJAT-27225 TaxID=1743144 RepID=UPI00080C2AFA|nr:hypothetical protein [Bacillus sp. FJAT-27225]OCA87693.1 hypothetical protein A8F94_07510 [Bacillus sp. FJAT-27225]
MKKLLSGLAAGTLAMGILAGSVFASVTFDASTGIGFVGKGDVQTALGWNNSELQKNAKNLNFTYVSEELYEVTVEWTTGEGTKGEKTHTVEHKRTASVNGDVTYESRKANQVNGFNLKGFENLVVEEAKLPEVGDEFPGKSGHTVAKVELVSRTSELFVNGVLLQQ